MLLERLLGHHRERRRRRDVHLHHLFFGPRRRRRRRRGLFTVSVSTGTGGASCVPPDVVIALDRTLTMHQTPDGSEPVDAPNYESSKWFQALTAIKGLVTPKLDKGIHFGLEMWPRIRAWAVSPSPRR